jgi:hypothetical protein
MSTQPGRPGAADLRVTLRSSELPDAVECPFCSGLDTEQFSAFGSALSVSQYYCRACRTVFEYMRRKRER